MVKQSLSKGRRNMLIITAILLLSLFTAYYIQQYTSLAIYNPESSLYSLNETITLAINQEIPPTSHLTININNIDYTKNISELTSNFNISELSINLEAFNISLPSGEYLLTVLNINFPAGLITL